jgi:membrane protease YdiL (CAAX protease family)
MLSALVITGTIAGRAGMRELAGRMFRWRVNPVWHLLAWLSPVALFAIAAVIARLIWGVWPDLGKFGQTEEYPQLPILVYWAANLLFYGWGEETGWRGFALPRLQKQHNAFTATFILSIFWAIWHLPLFWSIDGFMKMGAGGAIGWYFSILLGAVLLAWMYNRTQGSILIVAVFHATIDIVFSSPISGEFATILGMLMTLWGITMLLLYRPARLTHGLQQVPE